MTPPSNDTLAGNATVETKLAQQPDLERAFEFRELDMLHDARREWNFAMTKLDVNRAKSQLAGVTGRFPICSRHARLGTPRDWERNRHNHHHQTGKPAP